MLSKSCMLGGLAIVALCGAIAQACRAQTPEERLPACLACHGERGTSTTPEVPSLGGQKAAFMEIQLYLYRERMNRSDVMNQAMTGVRNEDLRVLAELLSRLPPPVAATENVDAAHMERGLALARRHRCNVCHNADLSGQANVPRIAGQREDYLLKVLRGYKNGARPGYDASMAEALQPVEEEDIPDLAYFAARQP